MGCSGPVCVLSGQPQCLQQQEGAAASATATTDGYQLFQKESCSDLSPRQLYVCVFLCGCVSLCGVLYFTEPWKSARAKKKEKKNSL